MAVTDFTVDRDTVKYVLNSSGDIASVAIDTPAIEYNTDGTYKGLLVEPASTNLCLQSEDINTTWGTVNATPTQDTEETPDGDTSNKYIKLVDDSGGGTGNVFVAQTITVSGGTKYTASVFLKRDGLNWAKLQAAGAGSVGDANPNKFFDLDNGVLGTGSAGIQDATIEEYPNGWYRCSITWTQGAADTSFDFNIYVANDDVDANVDLDGTSSIFVWGAQVETGPIATSYIPATTASVTRNKDDIELTSASSLIGQTEGTVYIEVDFRTATGTTQYILSANDGTSNNRFLIYSSGGFTSILISAGGSTVLATGAASLADGVQKLALAYANGDQEFYRNGSSIATGTGSLAALATLTDIDFQAFNATFQANMWIRAVALFPRRLSDAECEALTTL